MILKPSFGWCPPSGGTHQLHGEQIVNLAISQEQAELESWF